MTITSASVPALVPGAPAATGSAEGAPSPAAGLFELLLPADSAGDPKTAPLLREEPVTAPETIPSQAEQTNLVALLCAMTAQPVPPAPRVPLTLDGGSEAANPPVPPPADPSAAAHAVLPASASRPEPPAITHPANTAAPASAVAVGDRSEAGKKPSTAQPADSADPQKQALIPPEMPAAKSSPPPLATPRAESERLILPSPAEAAAALVSGQATVVKKPRGTAAAKPARSNMIEAPATNQPSRPGVPVARSNDAGLATPLAALGDQMPGRTQSNAQEWMPAGGGDANRGGGESFPMIAPTISTSVARPAMSAGDAGATAARPMSPAAVLDAVGLSLDRIQQRGSDRMDLRLSLEGGGEVSIELQVRNGAVHASFLTGSAELREALQQGWAQLASRSEGLGMPLAEPVFKAPATTSSNGGQHDFRERRQEPQQERTPFQDLHEASQPQKHTGRPAAPARTASSGLNAWA